jgi:hypothetical protein
LNNHLTITKIITSIIIAPTTPKSKEGKVVVGKGKNFKIPVVEKAKIIRPIEATNTIQFVLSTPAAKLSIATKNIKNISPNIITIVTEESCERKSLKLISNGLTKITRTPKPKETIKLIFLANALVGSPKIFSWVNST